MSRVPVEKLTRRVLLRELLEDELIDFNRVQTSPEWDALRTAIGAVIGFVGVAIEYREHELSRELAGMNGNGNGADQPPAEPARAALEPQGDTQPWP